VKYFICAPDKVDLAIPAEQIERIIPVTRLQTDVYETENGDAYLSIPALLRQNDVVAPHGLVLKYCPAGSVRKTILLTPRIDIELEIPEENIHSLPEVFTGRFSFFGGVYFNGSQNVILILNPEKLTKFYHVSSTGRNEVTLAGAEGGSPLD